MRIVQVIGTLLIAAGLYVLIKAPSVQSDRSLFKMGDLEAKLEQGHEVPAWVGWTTMGVGVMLVMAGSRKPI
jgi:hypothetical protein